MSNSAEKVVGTARARFEIVSSQKGTRGQDRFPRRRLALGPDPGGKCHMLFAPPGYGKSTVLRDWRDELVQSGWTVVFLRADAGSDCLARWMVQLGCPVPTDDAFQSISAAHALLDRLKSGKTALLVDDLDAARDPRISDLLNDIGSHLGDRQVLLVATVVKPGWPVERRQLEGRHRLLDRQVLAFESAETEMLIRRERPGVTDGFSVARFHAAVEGWPAVACLALQDGFELRSEESDPLDCRRVVAYLDEVTARLFEPDVAGFLEDCAVLGSASTALCRALLGGDKAAARFEDLVDRSGLFEPVNFRPGWFSLNRVLTEYFRRRAWTANEMAVRQLHRDAYQWHLAAAQPSEALRHAITGKDFETAVGLLKTHVRSMVRSSRLSNVFQTVGHIPRPLLIQNIRVVLPLLWGAIQARRLEWATEFADTIERFLDRTEDEAMAGEGLPYPSSVLRAVVAVARCVIRRYGDLSWADDLFVQNLRREFGGEAPLVDAKLLHVLAEMQIDQDNLEAAFVSLRESEHNYRLDENLFGRAEALASMINVRLLQGRFEEARGIAEQTLAEAVDSEGALPAAAEARLALAEMQYEQNNILGAERELGKAWTLIKERDDPRLNIRALALESEIRRACGAKSSDAMAPLITAEEMTSDRRITALRAQIKNLQALCAVHYGELDVAQALLMQNGYSLTAHARPPGLRILPSEEAGYFALALLHHRLKNPHVAMRVTKRLLAGAETAKRWKAAAAYRTFVAVLHGALDHQAEALRGIRDAIVLASNFGFVRSVTDVGTDARRLIGEFVEIREDQPRNYDSDLQIAYARQLASAERLAPLIGHSGDLPEPRTVGDLDLTDREIQILSLLAKGRRNREIADELLVKETTIKWHVRNLLEKSNCRGRTALAAWARGFRIVD